LDKISLSMSAETKGTSGRRRRVLLYGFAFFLPVLVVGLMSLDALSKRRQAVAALIESGLWNAGESVLNSIESELDRESSDARVSNPAGVQPTLSSASWRRFIMNAKSVPAAGLEGKSETESFRLTIREAEACEVRTVNPGRAAELFARAAALARSPAGRAQALNGQGRALRSSGRFEESLKIFRALGSEHGSNCDPAGHPFGLTAGLQVIETLRAMGRFEEAGKSLVASSERLRNGAWDLTPAQAAFFAGEIDRLAAFLSPEGRSSKWEVEYRSQKNRMTPFLEKLEFQDLVESGIMPAVRTMAEGDKTATPDRFHRLFVPWRDVSYLVTWRRPEGSAGQTDSVASGLCGRADVLLNEIIRRGRELAWKNLSVGVNLVVEGRESLSRDGRSGMSVRTADLAFRRWPIPWKIRVTATGAGGLEQSARRENVLFGALTAIVVGLMIAGIVLLRRDIGREAEVLRQKNEFLHNISHELKTPLTLIRLYTETIEQNPSLPEAEKADALKIIGGETEHLTRLINNVLELSRFEMGWKVFHFVEQDLADLIRSTIESFRYDLEKKGFTVDLDLSPDVPRLRLDREAMATVLTNLLGNAVKFSPAEKRVGIRLFRRGEEVFLEVSDRGIGIGPEDLPHIFEKFYRSKTEAVAQTSGSGLGLTLVKSLVEAQGGRVKVQSGPGEGSVFSAILPIRQGEAGELRP
jgi:signal transduction histidine kinase